MTHALLVDFGGVLTTSVLGSFATFCGTEGIRLEDFTRALVSSGARSDSPFARVETGAISLEAFEIDVAALLSDACGKPIAAAGLKRRMMAALVPDDAMRDAVRRARAAGVRTALVSNSWGGHDYPREEFSELFDALLISGEIGMRKPDAEIYRFAADALSVPVDSCIFIDDFRRNIDGAEAVGMTGLLHRSASETIPNLERLTGIALR